MLIIHELVDEKLNSRDKLVLLKIDFEKAYDMTMLIGVLWICPEKGLDPNGGYGFRLLVFS